MYQEPRSEGARKRVSGEALKGIIQANPEFTAKKDLDVVAWATFRQIRESGGTVNFPDILVTIDDLRGTQTETTQALRTVTALAEKAAQLPKEQPVAPGTLMVAAPEITVNPPTRGMALLSKLKEQSRIRIYVETGSNKGHQSASDTVARKLVEWFARTPGPVNPKLVIEFACNDEDAAGKIKTMLQGGKIGSVPVEVLVLSKSTSLSQVDYAFSGAVDRPETTFPRLKARSFIGLQPYGWAGGAEMVIQAADKDMKFTVLSQASSMNAWKAMDQSFFPLEFKRLPFTEEAEASEAFVPKEVPDKLVTLLLDAAKSSATAKVPIHICPIYGMGKGQPMEGYRRQVWTNLVSALAPVAHSLGSNVILLNLSLDLGSDAEKTWGDVKQAFKGSKDVAIFDQLLDQNTVGSVLDAFKGGARVCVCTVGGSKSKQLMDRAYRESTLPPIFEGQGSLTQIMSMGRPFVKCSLRAAQDPSWPSDYLPIPGLEDMDLYIQRVANSIIEDWKEEAFEHRAELAELFVLMYQRESKIGQYFDACRKMVTNLAFDRLAWAAEVLDRFTEIKGIGQVKMA